MADPEFVAHNAVWLSRKLWYYQPKLKRAIRKMGIKSGGMTAGNSRKSAKNTERLLIVTSASKQFRRIWSSFWKHVAKRDRILINSMREDIRDRIPDVERCYLVKSVYDRDVATMIAIGTDFYQMKSKPRGYFVIINNKNFTGPSGEIDPRAEREYTEKDVNKMIAVALGLGFVPRVSCDLTLDQMNEYLDMISKDRSLEKHDAFVLMIMSHGKNESIISTNGQPISLEKIKNRFISRVCPALDDKPKIMIFVCCRGDGIVGPESDNLHLKDATGRAKGDGVPVIAKDPQTPREEHMVTIFSTITGFVSWHRPLDGSHFVEIFARTLAEDACRHSFRQILDTVSDKHKKDPVFPDAKQKTYQTPDVLSPEHKEHKLFFNPGYPKDEDQTAIVTRAIANLALDRN